MPLVTPEPAERPPPTTPGGAPIDVPADDRPPAKPSLDMVFEILRADRRREVLRYLDAHDGESTVGTLAEHLAAEENGTEPTLVTSPQRKRTYVALYQIHLPKLDDYGVVDYERDRGTVRLLGPAWWYIEYLYFEPGEPPFDGGDDRPRSVRDRFVEWLLGE